MQSRERALERLGNRHFDAVVVGGGINGAIATLALATSGVAVACVTKADFAAGTSQQTSNLIWGGFKYLEGFEIPLVASLSGSRNRLARAFPSQLMETRFLATLDRGGPHSPPVAVLGANAYWLLGRCFTGRPRWRSRSWVREAEPVVDAASARGAIEYSDYVLVDNDARFVTQLLLDAEQRGAVISNYTELVGAERAGGTWAMQVRDHASGTQLGLKATVVVNAAGPYLDDVGELVRTTTTKRLVLSKGIHLVVPRITGSGRVLAFHDDTNRLFYVIPMGHRSAIGTTDTRTDDPDEPVTDDDRQYLLAQINRRLRLAEPLGVDDVIAERVGVRPLVVDSPAEIDDQDWTALSRRHHLEIDEQRGVISILGGKLSDCLNVGEEVVAAARRVGIEGPRPLTGTWLGEAGARDRQRFRHDAVAAGLGWPPRYEDEATYADVLWRRYGNRARQVLEIVVAEPSLGASLMELADCSEAEIVHLRQAERIVTIDDFLRRRTPLAQLNRPGDLAADRGVRRAVEVLLGERGLVELGQAPYGFHPEER